jgi:uncharacterized protein (TIGR00106 family)
MLCEFSISPFGRSESVSGEVAQIIDLIDRSGLPYKTHAMGTIVEGEWDAIMDLIRRCHMLMKLRNARVITNIHIDDRQNATNRLNGKVASIERHLGHEIRK